jgi:hypothetical protein
MRIFDGIPSVKFMNGTAYEYWHCQQVKLANTIEHLSIVIIDYLAVSDILLHKNCCKQFYPVDPSYHGLKFNSL